MIKKRLAALRRLLGRQNLDALLVTDPFNRRYLSGFRPDDGQWGESSGALLISQADAVLLTDFRYELSAREQAPLFTVRIYKKGLAPELAALLAGSGVRRLGFESQAMLMAQKERLDRELEGLELVPRAGLVSRLRVCKDSLEMRALRRSLGLMEEVLERVLAGELIGRTERQAALEIVRAVEDAGAEGAAFAPIVASGPNGAEPHAEPGDRVIQAGEPVILDVGARWDGYCSDMTRTVTAGGWERADETMARVYPVVRRAQLAAQEGIRPGMTGAQADALARRVIEEAGFGPRFGHSLGHGVGLAAHEAPSLSPNSTDRLRAGMVFTLEPGVYLPGWGGVRLEQMVELTDQGCRLLNRLDDFHDFS